MKCFYSKLLEGREASWHDSKHCASDRMKEIAHFFSGPWVRNSFLNVMSIFVD